MAFFKFTPEWHFLNSHPNGIFYLKYSIEGMSNNSNRKAKRFKYAKNGNKVEIEKLLDERVDIINVRDENGFTALMYASDKGYTDTVKLLVEKGADINFQHREEGYTALTLASQEGHTEIVRLLVDAEAKLDIQEINGFTALIYASSYGHTEIVEILIQKGAKLDIQDINFYDTALIRASYRGHTEIVRLLLEKGADINLKNKDGKTAIDLAEDPEIKKMLLKAKEERNERSGQEHAFGYEKMTGQSAKPGSGPTNFPKLAGIKRPRGSRKRRASRRKGTRRVAY